MKISIFQFYLTILNIYCVLARKKKGNVIEFDENDYIGCNEVFSESVVLNGAKVCRYDCIGGYFNCKGAQFQNPPVFNKPNFVDPQGSPTIVHGNGWKGSDSNSNQPGIQTHLSPNTGNTSSKAVFNHINNQDSTSRGSNNPNPDQTQQSQSFTQNPQPAYQPPWGQTSSQAQQRSQAPSKTQQWRQAQPQIQQRVQQRPQIPQWTQQPAQAPQFAQQPTQRWTQQPAQPQQFAQQPAQTQQLIQQPGQLQQWTQSPPQTQQWVQPSAQIPQWSLQPVQPQQFVQQPSQTQQWQQSMLQGLEQLRQGKQQMLEAMARLEG